MYSGSSYAERPKSFFWQDEWFEVIQVNKQWRTPEGLHYRVATADERIFDLEYVYAEDCWEIEPK